MKSLTREQKRKKKLKKREDGKNRRYQGLLNYAHVIRDLAPEHVCRTIQFIQITQTRQMFEAMASARYADVAAPDTSSETKQLIMEMNNINANPA